MRRTALFLALILLGCSKPQPPPPQTIVVMPAYPVPPIQGTPWPQVFFPPPSTTIINQRQLVTVEQLQQTQQNLWIYDPVRRRLVRPLELAPTNP